MVLGVQPMSNPRNPHSVLFVCLGNICRSPAAEGILRHQAETEHLEITISSCGLGDWHQGELPDPRMRRVASARGIQLESHAQSIQKKMFETYDWIFAADHAVLRELITLAETQEQKAKIHLMSAFANQYKDLEIPDPYSGDESSFEYVLDMLEECCHGILEQLKEKSS